MTIEPKTVGEWAYRLDVKPSEVFLVVRPELIVRETISVKPYVRSIGEWCHLLSLPEWIVKEIIKPEYIT